MIVADASVVVDFLLARAPWATAIEARLQGEAAIVVRAA